MRKLCFLFLVASMVATVSFAQVQLAELTPSTRANNDWFGIAVAATDSTVVVADFDPNIEQFGSVDVYVKLPGGWTNATQNAKLVPSDNGIGFGTSVAILGNIVVVGAANTSNFSKQAETPGAVYVFQKPAGGWSGVLTETLKITASDGQNGDAFGNSVAIGANGTIVAGAFFANNFAGRVYVFTPNGSSYSQAAELTATDGGLLSYLGCSVAISGSTVIAGSDGQGNFAGAVYVFVEPSGGWTNMTETAELTAAQTGNLGFSVAIEGNTVVAGSPGAFGGFGAAFVYLEPPSGWISTSSYAAALAEPRAGTGLSFAQSVGIGTGHSGTAVVVGAPGTNVGSNLEQGAAYVYLMPAGGWRNMRQANAQLLASDGQAFDTMGASVATAGNNVVAGAPASNAPGAAYVFGP